jgi:hypothetical protein
MAVGTGSAVGTASHRHSNAIGIGNFNYFLK